MSSTIGVIASHRYDVVIAEKSLQVQINSTRWLRTSL